MAVFKSRFWFAKPIANTANAFNPTGFSDGVNFFANSLETYIYNVGVGVKVVTPMCSRIWVRVKTRPGERIRYSRD